MQNQPDFQASAAQVVEELRLGARIQSTAGFELEKHDGLDDHVGSKCPNRATPEMDRNWNFSLNSKTVIEQSELHALRVYRFEVAGSQLPMDLVEGAKYSVRNRFVEQFSHTSHLVL